MVRAVWMAGLWLAVAACGNGIATSQAPPPPASVFLQASALVPGEVFTVSTVVPEGTTVFVFGSPNGVGGGTCLPRGECLELAQPNVLLGSDTAGIDGMVEVRVPSRLTSRLTIGQSVYLQGGALTRIGSTRVITFSPVLVKVAGDLDGDGVAPPTDCDDTDPALTGSDLDLDGKIDCDDPCPDDKLNTCVCPPGRALEGGVCVDCRMGTYSADGLACVDCEVGSAASATGSASCLPCAPGFVAPNTGMASCTPCDRGTFIDLVGQAECISCPEGEVALDVGLIACEACTTPGTRASSDGTTCEPCPTGSASPNGEGCDLCERGTFSASEGSESCEVCPTGTAAPHEGSESCAPCFAGTYASDVGSATCTACDAGSYANSEGLDVCLPCAPGTFAGEAGAFECRPCPLDTFAASFGATSCEPCVDPLFTTAVGAAVCESCLEGTYRDTVTDQCIECPSVGVTCEGGVITPIP